MSLEDEVAVADIEVAGRLLTDSIARDLRFASCDLQDALDAARFASHPYSTPPKEVMMTPHTILPFHIQKCSKISGGTFLTSCNGVGV
jgi:hypothetical protein